MHRSRLSTFVIDCKTQDTGAAAKLYSGGGDDVAHSSESAPQGLSPAGAPRRLLHRKFHSVMPVPTPKTTPPMLMIAGPPESPSQVFFEELP